MAEEFFVWLGKAGDDSDYLFDSIVESGAVMVCKERAVVAFLISPRTLTKVCNIFDHRKSRRTGVCVIESGGERLRAPFQVMNSSKQSSGDERVSTIRRKISPLKGHFFSTRG